MIEDIPVVNAVGHAYNLSAANARGPVGAMVRDGFYGIHAHFNPPEVVLPPELFQVDQSPELLARTHFLESDVDLVVWHTLRLDSLFDDGLCSHAKAVELVRRWPQRFVTYLGIDPTLGTERAIADLEQQRAELPDAVGLKFYPDQVEPYRTFRMDDPEALFPVYEKAVELGLRTVAVHKALPNGPVPLAPYRIDDVEGAAMAFPHLNFEIVHAGMAFVPETAYAIARFPNVYANLEITTMLLAKAPRMFAEVLAELLFWGGPQKVIYSDGALFTHPQVALSRFWDFQLPPDLCEKYGLPPLTREDRAAMLGGNWARTAGVELATLVQAQRDDEWAQARRERGALDAPWTSWHAVHGPPPSLPAPTPSPDAAATVGA